MERCRRYRGSCIDIRGFRPLSSPEYITWRVLQSNETCTGPGASRGLAARGCKSSTMARIAAKVSIMESAYTRLCFISSFVSRRALVRVLDCNDMNSTLTWSSLPHRSLFLFGRIQREFSDLVTIYYIKYLIIYCDYSRGDHSCIHVLQGLCAQRIRCGCAGL